MLVRKWFHKLSVALLFCGASVAPAATVEEDFLAASSRWKAAALRDYEYSVSNSSIIVTGCGDERPVRLTIHAGKATRGFYIETGSGQAAPVGIPGKCLKHFITIDSLFDDIARLIGHCEGLQASYDARYGYPSRVDTRCMLDGQYPVRVWDVTPAQK
jgi:hypothetical protein